MSRWIRLSCVLCICGAFLFVALPGCNKPDVTPSKGGKTPDEHLDYGPHGGPCAEWGAEDFHAEFIVDASKKQVTIYILDGDAKAAPKVDADKVTNVKVTIKSVKPPVPVDLTYSKEASGDQGIAFTAVHDAFAKPEGMKVNVSGKVDGKPYSGDVEYKAPKKSAQLYLTPGGIYTAADIAANGAMSPEEKFKGIKAKHSKVLNPGDRICPITSKKAQANINWTVQGQSYEFCCSPCVHNFLDQAHDDQEAKLIKNADEYVFKGK